MKTKRLTIEVTEADIEGAVPKDSGHCAIADAIGRQLPDVSNVTVDLQSIRWTDRKAGERYTYLTPRVAQALLLDFDQGDRDFCQPLLFRLDHPVHVTPIKRSSGKEMERRRAEQTERVAAVRAKRDAGESLTREEKRTLTRADARAANPPQPRPSSQGKRQVQPNGTHDPDGAPGIVITGGTPPPLGALAHGRGRIRQFGVKSAGSPQPAPRIG